METPNQPVGQASPTTTPGETPKAAPAQTTETAQPKKYADRYETIPDLEKGYKEAQATLTKQAQELAQYKKGQTAAAVETLTEQPKADQTPPSQMFPMLVQEYLANNGKLSDQTIDVVAKQMGMSKSQAALFTDAFAQVAKQGNDKLVTQLKEAGVSLTPQEVAAQAGKYLSPEQWDIVQKSLDAGMPGSFIDAAKLVQKNAKPAAQVGSVQSDAVGGGYGSAKDIHAATMHTSFGIDKNYTRNVEARIRATSDMTVKEWEQMARKR